MRNKQTIRLKEDLTAIQFRLSMLRKAKISGDMETVNNTQLGRLKDQEIKYEIMLDKL